MSVKNSVSPSELVEFLNEAVKRDPQSTTSLFANRVFCSCKTAKHETIQVMAFDCTYLVGVIGFLNGAFGLYDDGPNKGSGPIAYKLDGETGLIEGFMEITKE